MGDQIWHSVFQLCEIDLQSVGVFDGAVLYVHLYKEDVLFDTDTADEQNPYWNRGSA